MSWNETYEELAEAMLIFAKYEGVEGLATEHDVIYAGPDSHDVTPEDMIRLEELGWHVDNDYDCFGYFT